MSPQRKDSGVKSIFAGRAQCDSSSAHAWRAGHERRRIGEARRWSSQSIFLLGRRSALPRFQWNDVFLKQIIVLLSFPISKMWRNSKRRRLPPRRRRGAPRIRRSRRRGIYGARAGARTGYRAGARGAYRVGGRYYGGRWYGTGRRWYRGRWWPYGVGGCWRSSPIGYVWICG